jgi:predicted nucleic acid-binding protein
MVALYANENFPRQVVEALRALGHDVLTTAEAGNAGRALPDAEVLAFAREAGRAVVTLNRRDFIRLHAAVAEHAGIVVCTQDADFGRAKKPLSTTSAACDSASWRSSDANPRGTAASRGVPQCVPRH